MKLDAVDRVKGRPKKEGQVVPNYQGKKSSEIAAEGSGESYKQVERYIRLTYLTKPLLDYVDEKRGKYSFSLFLCSFTAGAGVFSSERISSIPVSSSFRTLLISFNFFACARLGNTHSLTIT